MRWAGRIALLAALCGAAVGGDAVSAQPPAVPERGGPAHATQAPHAASAPFEQAPSRTLGISAQDSWLGD